MIDRIVDLVLLLEGIKMAPSERKLKGITEEL
jgi:hypothetical protein